MGIDFVTLALAKKYADSKTGQGSGVSVQPDWNQNDETKSDYVKGRTHYEGEIKTALRENVVTVNCNNSGFSGTYGDYYYKDVYAYWNGGWDYLVGKTIKIVFDNKTYDVLINSRNEMANLNDYPFEIYLVNDYTRFGVRESGVHTFEFYLIERELKQLDPKYIKDMYHEKPVKLFEVENAEFVENGYVCEPSFPIVDGNAYIVNWDDVEYTCKAYIFEGLPVIGNTADFGGKGNGEPFYIGYHNIEDVTFVGNLGELTTHTFSITENVCNTIPPKYIKDMYYDNGTTVTEVVPETTVEGFEIMQGPIRGTRNAISMVPVEGATYTVVWDGVSYDAICKYLNSAEAPPIPYIGNENYLFMTSGGDIPFAIIFDFGEVILLTESDAPSHTISVTEIVHDLKQLDIKYLPILEETIEVVFEADSVVNNSEFVGSEYKKLLGEYTVTIDGISQTIWFADDDDFSFARNGPIYIETWNGGSDGEETWDAGIHFQFPDDEPHSVKIEEIKNIIKEEHLPDSVKAQPDWNQNEPNGAGYIANRTHYDDIIQTPKTRDEIISILGGVGTSSDSGIIDGVTFRVVVDGVIYDDVPVHSGCYLAGSFTWCIGDAYSSGKWRTTDYGFAYPGHGGVITNLEKFPNGIENIEICTVEQELKQLDPKYIKDMYYEKGIIASLSDGDSFNWEKDKPYTLRVDGVVYEFDSMYMGDYHNASGDYIWSLGATPRVSGTSINVKIWDYPFSVYAFGYGEPKPTTTLKFEDGTFNHTVEVLEDYELHQIDPKYIVLPVGGDELGVVKNGGSVYIDGQGQMYYDCMVTSIEHLPSVLEVFPLVIVATAYGGNPTGVHWDGPLLVLRGINSYGVYSISAIDGSGAFYKGYVGMRDGTVTLRRADSMVVTITATEDENGEWVFTADKTIAEIEEALQSGTEVSAVFDGMKHTVALWDHEYIEFEHAEHLPENHGISLLASKFYAVVEDGADVWHLDSVDAPLAIHVPVYIVDESSDDQTTYRLEGDIDYIFNTRYFPDIYLRRGDTVMRCIEAGFTTDACITVGFYSILEGTAIKLMVNADGSVTEWMPM